MKRGGWIKRRTPMKARRSKARRVDPSRVRDEGHKAEVRLLPCVSRNMPGASCKGIIQAAHQDEGKGGGLKTSDLTCVPQCVQCHADWGANQGPFLGWDRERKRLWFRTVVLLTQQTLQRRRELGPAVSW